MNLKDAATIAARVAGQDHFGVAVLRDGKIRACSPHGGVEIHCPEATLDLAVDASALLKMVKAAGPEAKLSVGKGRKLTIKWGKSSYSLQSIPEDKEPPWPEFPTDGWVELNDSETRAICIVADASNAPEWMVRLHPHWCLGTDGGAVAVAWVVGKIPKPVSLTPSLFADLTGMSAVAVDERRVYLVSGDQSRWAPQLAAGFHDAMIDQLVAGVRAEPRAQLKVAFPAIERLAHDALAAVGSKAQVFRLEADGAALRFTGGESNSAYGARRYESEIEVVSVGTVPPHHAVGITPDRLGMLAKMFDRHDGLMSIGTPMSALVVWSGKEVVVEVFCVPGLLE